MKQEETKAEKKVKEEEVNEEEKRDRVGARGGERGGGGGGGGGGYTYVWVEEGGKQAMSAMGSERSGRSSRGTGVRMRVGEPPTLSLSCVGSARQVWLSVLF
ncbi:hypothetical protein E2C01_083379 [Portunus trituberculatus]|uniref:Uncharacterized protein n=1 Tax=Portunus trituberculatus TaxID=210409 RepID=A0A5B7J7N4_PORTR|nr:hypothetical protein [Portunus trituberculatus]